MKKDLFDLTGKVVLITGGGGFLASKSFAPAILEYNGTVIMADHNEDKVIEVCKELNKKYGNGKLFYEYLDITDKTSIENVIEKYPEINCLINSACNNPKQSKDSKTITSESRFENFSLDTWKKDIEIGLTGTFLCSQILGNHFIKNNGGKIINIGSDLALIQQDQSLYRIDGILDEDQPVKPVSYGVLKSGVVSLTKYMASYPLFNKHNVRINCICPGPIFNPDMSADFVEKLSKKLLIGRLGKLEELKGIIVYLCGDNSDFMQGSIISIDGGRTII